MDYFTIVFAFAMGGLSLWMSQRLIRLYLAVRNWNRVQAKILSKEVVLSTKSNTKARHMLKAEYLYLYNGVEYKGDKVFMVELLGGRQLFTKNDAENRIAKLESTPSIFVNPSDPKQSVVYSTGIGFYILILAMGVLSILFGISKMI